MTYADLMRTIRGTVSSEWVYHDSERIYTYRHDLNIRIEREDSRYDKEQFDQAWATCYSNPNARQQKYAIYYGASLVETFWLVSVDGGRATLPMPCSGTTVISAEGYQLARIVDDGRLDEYIKRAGLTVEK